jgi:hypothetical protein
LQYLVDRAHYRQHPAVWRELELRPLPAPVIALQANEGRVGRVDAAPPDVRLAKRGGRQQAPGDLREYRPPGGPRRIGQPRVRRAHLGSEAGHDLRPVDGDGGRQVAAGQLAPHGMPGWQALDEDVRDEVHDAVVVRPAEPPDEGGERARGIGAELRLDVVPVPR